MESRAPYLWTRRCRGCFAFIACLMISGCAARVDSETLVQVNLLDPHGFSEVVTSKNRLAELDKSDFVGAVQPYQKVSRIYKKKSSGNLRGLLTSYHPSGQIYQYLETKGAYASGAYKEWHPNGQQKIEANIAAGKADLDRASACTWVFDGPSRVWSESGALQADMTYVKGLLDGLMTLYYPDGAVQSLERFESGRRCGKMLHFYQGGGLYKEEAWVDGEKDGYTQIFSPEGMRVAFETFSKNKLEEGLYFSLDGIQISQVVGGHGKASYPNLEGGRCIHVLHGGFIRNIVIESAGGLPLRSWDLLDGKRHGEEVIYDAQGKPQTEISWREGQIHGEQKSWYPNGQLESLRSMENNKRSGPCTAWYESGELMLVEEYEEDRLVEGQYFRRGEREPVSRVHAGSGTATLFDGHGTRLKKVLYEKGEPKAG